MFTDDLVAQAVQGDEDALSELLLACDGELRTRLSGRIGRRYRSAFSVDDVLQITYLEAFLHIHRFKNEGGAGFVNWLTRIAENNLLNAIRELNRKKRPPRRRQIGSELNDDSYLALLATLTGSQTTPSQRAAKQEIKQAIEAALDRMPADYAKVVRQYDFQGRSAPEIAEDLGRSPGAIHMLKARAHDYLAEILGNESRFLSHSG